MWNDVINIKRMVIDMQHSLDVSNVPVGMLTRYIIT
jgi:hypothetical protein